MGLTFIPRWNVSATRATPLLKLKLLATQWLTPAHFSLISFNWVLEPMSKNRALPRQAELAVNFGVGRAILEHFESLPHFTFIFGDMGLDLGERSLSAISPVWWEFHESSIGRRAEWGWGWLVQSSSYRSSGWGRLYAGSMRRRYAPGIFRPARLRPY